MSHKLFTDPRVFEFILKIDADTVATVAASECPHCGCRLDRAFFPRKLRGVPAAFEASFAQRPSFCCRADGCRKRLTPELIAYLGRRVYISAVVVLIAAMRQGATPTRLRELYRLAAVSPRTVRRWLVWWREVFPISKAWRLRSGDLVPAVDERRLPASLFERLAAVAGDHLGGLKLCLRMLMA